MSRPSIDPDVTGEPPAEESPSPAGDPPTAGAMIRHGMLLLVMAATPFLLLAAFFVLDGFIR